MARGRPGRRRNAETARHDGACHEARGRLPAELELRTDLNANALRYFVRNGSGAMPMFRKAELTDADIDAIAGYLTATAQANGRGQD